MSTQSWKGWLESKKGGRPHSDAAVYHLSSACTSCAAGFSVECNTDCRVCDQTICNTAREGPRGRLRYRCGCPSKFVNGRARVVLKSATHPSAACSRLLSHLTASRFPLCCLCPCCCGWSVYWNRCLNTATSLSVTGYRRIASLVCIQNTKLLA